MVYIWLNLSQSKLLWSELRPEGLTADYMSAVVEMVQGAGAALPIEARVAASKAYLKIANPLKSNGGYIVHLNYGSLNEMMGGPLAFVPDTKTRLVRAYNKVDEPITRPELITVKDGAVMYKGAELALGSDYSALAADESLIVALPTLEWAQSGVKHTRSAWLLVGCGVDEKRAAKLRGASDPYADFK